MRVLLGESAVTVALAHLAHLAYLAYLVDLGVDAIWINPGTDVTPRIRRHTGYKRCDVEQPV